MIQSNWTVKYYKGLGTSTNKEAKEYFSDLEQHIITFKFSGEECNKKIDMVFNKKKAN